MDQTALEAAARIAGKSLGANIRRLSPDGPTVLSAGARQFRSVWTRDFCFASGGLIAAGAPMWSGNLGPNPLLPAEDGYFRGFWTP